MNQLVMKMRIVKMVGIVFLFVLYSGYSALASEEKSLDTVVVTATKSPKAIRDLSSSVSVVTHDEIDHSTANSATDILDMLPGVSVQKTGNFGRADVSIRGYGSRGRRVLVMVDGKPEKMGLYGCTITHALPLDNVEHIEVLRGSSSVIYGADALGGVVNIITKKPEKKCEGDASFSMGSFDTEMYQVRQGGALPGWDYYVTFDERRSKGHLPNAHYDDDNYSLRLDRKLSESLETTLTSRYFDAFQEEPAPSPEGTWNRYRRGFVDWTLNGDFESVDGMLKVYRNFGKHRFSDGWESEDYTNGVLFHTNFIPREGNHLLLGLEYREQGGEVLSGGIVGDYDKEEEAVFFHDDQRFLNDTLTVDAGLRYNHDSFAGDIWLPSVGCVWQARETTLLRISAERGFRAPHLNELEFFMPSNHDLDPEKSWNYEIGINQQLSKVANFDIVYFIIDAKDFITVSQGKFQNIDKVKFKGVEASLEYTLSENLTSRFGYTYMDLGENTVGRAEHEFNIYLDYQRNKFNISLNGQYVTDYFAANNSRDKISDFFVCNSKAAYDLSEHVSIYVMINNILNTKHQLYVDLPGTAAGVYRQPERNVYAGMQCKW